MSSAIVIYLPMYALSEAVNETGKTLSIWQQGYAVHVCLMFYSNFIFWVHIRDWNQSMILCASIVFLVTAAMFIICQTSESVGDVYRTIPELTESKLFMLTMLLTTFIAVAPVYAYMTIVRLS